MDENKVTTAAGYHVPVLLKQSVDGLNIRPGGVYVDVTFGGGGHSREILSRLDAEGHLYGFDQDLDVVKQLDNEPFNQSNFTFVRSNFRYLKNWMRYYGVDHIDGLLADLGVSSHHFDDESRGFSFRFDSPLDMRMNAKAELTAADVVNGYDEKQLADVFYLYGELKNSAGWQRPSSRPARRRRSALPVSCSTSWSPSSTASARRRIWPRCSRPCALRSTTR